jgi:ADP-ribose pyrophosphatase
MSRNAHIPWEVLESREVFAAPPWIQVHRQRVRLSCGKVVDDFHRVQMSDYTVVVAQTADGRFILERQYKHGVGKVCLMLPAGGIALGEEPLAAAQRELIEETGYEAEGWRFLGRYACNANYGCGHVHIFTARNARRVTEPCSGDLEEMEIVLLDEGEVQKAVRDGAVGALGAVAALALALDLRVTEETRFRH